MQNENQIKKYKGLSDKEVLESKNKYGINKLDKKKKENLLIKILKELKEPMFLLLIIAASVYFIVGEYSDGIIMLVFVIGICFIEFIQENKTENALEELNKLSSLNVKVIRNNEKKVISSEDIAVGDIIILEEGDSIPADGKVLYAQSLGINESALTGEKETVYKNTKEDNENHFKKNMCYSATSVTNGMGIIEITAVGINTEIGKIGKSLSTIKKEKTPLETQINKIVFICTIICLFVFIFTIIINYINNEDLEFTKRIVESLLAGITIAMATIPEEIPVVLTVFLAMGAWRLTKEKTLTKNLKQVETLGAINVLCTDKTGTLTENKMVIKDTYKYKESLYETAYLSCPEVTYDEVDIAIKEYCKKGNNNKKNKITKEYPFTPENKMLAQLWDNNLLCVKGACESVLPLCNLNEKENNKITIKINNYSKEGYKVIAVAKQEITKEIPKTINDAKLSFEGLIVLYDPPRKGIKKSIEICNKAGIRVIMITGDNGITAKGIAKKINISNYEEVITGPELEKMSDEELFDRVKKVNIYARVYPNHKMRIINALQKDKKIVSMTGDGVNDAPALKKANIGIAMGKRGTNVAKEAADIILLDDNFNTIVKAIKDGRGIYENIKKSLSYILVIHIPVALLALFTPIFKLPTLLLPIHIVLLELLIDPTSSIIFERIKPSDDLMLKKPRNIEEPIMNKYKIISCLTQGFYIFLATFINYLFLIKRGIENNEAISITYSMLVLSVILVAFQLKSNDITIKEIKNSLKDKFTLLVNLSIIIGLILIIYVPFFNKVANTSPIELIWWFYIIIASFITVIPFDISKKINKY